MTPTSTNNDAIKATNSRMAVFPGSFNPFTRGHADIVERGLRLFDRIVVAVGCNIAKGTADAEASADAIRRIYAGDPRVEVTVYTGLTYKLAQQLGAVAILRAVRSVKDFEYERDLAAVNMQLSGIDSVILYSRPELASLSSSMVRELAAYGQDITPFLP